MRNLFFTTVTKCTTIKSLITNNNYNYNYRHMFPGETFLQVFNKQFSKTNILSWKKKVYWIQPLWCTAKLDKFYAICFKPTEIMAQIWHLQQELLNLTSKIWKPSYDWMTWCRQQSEDISYGDGRFEPMTNSVRSLTWAYKLKALKSSF